MNRFLVLAVLIGTLALGGCASAKRGLRDSPVEPAAKQNNAPAHIITMPNHFENVAFKCDGHNGIYSTTRQAAPVIVPNDPNCAAQ